MYADGRRLPVEDDTFGGMILLLLLLLLLYYSSASRCVCEERENNTRAFVFFFENNFFKFSTQMRKRLSLVFFLNTRACDASRIHSPFVFYFTFTHRGRHLLKGRFSGEEVGSASASALGKIG